MMQNVIDHGTGFTVRARGFTAPAAGKTGTSHDAWFAGYTSNLLCIVWVGYDDYSDLKLAGGSTAGPIWAEFMKRAVRLPQYSNTAEFTPPSRRGHRLTGQDHQPACHRKLPGSIQLSLRRRLGAEGDLRPRRSAQRLPEDPWRPRSRRLRRSTNPHESSPRTSHARSAAIRLGDSSSLRRSKPRLLKRKRDSGERWWESCMATAAEMTKTKVRTETIPTQDSLQRSQAC